MPLLLSRAECWVAEGCCGVGSFTQSKGFVLPAYKLVWEHVATLLGRICGAAEG